MTKKDVTIIGGTFDPVHNGHVAMAKYLSDNYISDEIWIMPSYDPPLKEKDGIASYNDRVNMLMSVFEGMNRVIITEFEKEYYKNDKTYTVDILNDIKKKYTNINPVFVVGFDSIKNIHTWKNYLELLKHYEFYIFDREDPEFLTLEHKHFYLDMLGKNKGINFHYEILPGKIPSVSSTEIRELLKDREKNKEKLLKMIDINVYNYIKANNLYV